MKNSYSTLLKMALIHFPIMYLIMYSMVSSLDNIFLNLNNFYMAGMMVAPMLVLEPLLMKDMYKNKRLNIVICASSALLLAVLYTFMRYQTFVGDKQFLTSMIPHHSGAILMCDKANIQDGEIKALCSEIIKGQKNEIDQMKKILERL